MQFENYNEWRTHKTFFVKNNNSFFSSKMKHLYTITSAPKDTSYKENKLQ